MMQMRRDCGFSLTEVLVVLALMAIVAAISVPQVIGSLDNMKLDTAVRGVHSEMQNARLKAVSANRPMRIRFDCPGAGQFRMVELIGTPAVPDSKDTAGDRCSETTYPYPVRDANALTRPNNDGPIRFITPGMTFTASRTIEFWPDGTAHADTSGTNPWPAIVAPVTISVKFKDITQSLTVNGVGKIQIQ